MNEKRNLTVDYSQLLTQWALVQPEKPCLIADGRVYTYADVDARVESYARQLQRVLPERGTILIVRRGPFEQLVCFLGAEKAGLVPVLGHPDMTDTMARHLARVRHIRYLDTGSIEAGSEETMDLRDLCMGVLSSGTTGLPKLMFRTYESWAGFFPEQCRLFGIQAGTVAFTEGSMSFTGNLNVWASILYAGATLVMENVLRPKRWAERMKRHGVTYLYLVPVKLKLLLRTLDCAFPAVRTVMAGSQLLDGMTAMRLKRVFPESEIYLYYGASELNYITSLTYEELLQHPMSVGRPCKGVRVFIRDGLIYIDSPYHVQGMPRPCTLNDAGYFDPDGYLIFEGRRGNVVNKGGLTISCAKVEQALMALPFVSDAVVLPCEDRERGQEMAAFLVLKDAHGPAEIRSALLQRLLPAEIPRYFRRVEQLPLLGVGKVDDQALRKLL
jgi:long-chain acyl-CoA synthetase